MRGAAIWVAAFGAAIVSYLLARENRSLRQRIDKLESTRQSYGKMEQAGASVRTDRKSISGRLRAGRF
jgi:hypothetical protein